jgi:tetratricopeptide (TPR) repeat protein
VQLDDYQGAITAYDGAIKKRPAWRDPWFDLKYAYYYRGTCYLSTGGIKEAAADFSQAMGLPGDLPAGPAQTAQVLHKLSLEFAKLKQYPEAVKWNKQAIALMPDEATKEQYRSALRVMEQQKP